MKDYSKFIQSSYGFITKYEIVGDEIHVYTAETKKGEPHKYPATKEWIKYVEDRLENQYKLLFENKDFIKEDFMKQCRNTVKRIAMILIGAILGLGAGFSIVFSSVVSGVLSIILSLLVVLASKKRISNIGENFDEEINTFESYFANRKLIETTVKKDKNPIEYLTSKATKKIASNEKLKEQGTIDSVFNIDFMDNINPKDLKKIVDRYLISVGLNSEQTFVMDDLNNDELNKSKVRKRVSNKK